MSDPKALPHLPFSRPCISEAAALEVADVVRSGWITSGPKVLQFEKDFCAYTGAANAVAMCSATAGLDLAVQCLDLKPGDEVIVPSINWVSGPNMIELNGGRCVFCEVDPTTLNMDLAHVAKLISPRTRAIMPVHFAGAPVDLDALRRLALAGKQLAGRDILIIEDAAHAAGTRWNGKAIGGDSDIAVFSFHPTKNITTAEGGMVTCRSADIAARLRLGRFHGIRKDAWKNPKGGGPYGLYLTLTNGYGGGMPGFPALSPEQRYAVAHYVRETMVKTDNKANYVADSDAVKKEIPPPGGGGDSVPVAISEEPEIAREPVKITAPVLPLMAGMAQQETADRAALSTWLIKASANATPGQQESINHLSALVESAPAVVAALRQSIRMNHRDRFTALLADCDGSGIVHPYFALLPANRLGELFDHLRSQYEQLRPQEVQ